MERLKSAGHFLWCLLVAIVCFSVGGLLWLLIGIRRFFRAAK